MLTYTFNNQLYIATKIVNHEGIDYQEFRSSNIRKPHTLYATKNGDDYIEVSDETIANALYEKNKSRTIKNGQIIAYNSAIEEAKERVEHDKAQKLIDATKDKNDLKFARYYAKKWGGVFWD